MELKVGNSFAEFADTMDRNETNLMKRVLLIEFKLVENEKGTSKINFTFLSHSLGDSAWDASSRGSNIALLLSRTRWRLY